MTIRYVLWKGKPQGLGSWHCLFKARKRRNSSGYDRAMGGSASLGGQEGQTEVRKKADLTFISWNRHWKPEHNISVTWVTESP